MDPYLANLNLDPPKHSSELVLGLVPALLLNLAFFGVVLLGAQPGDIAGNDSDRSLALTREMGGPRATQPEPATAAPAPSPATTPPSTPVAESSPATSVAPQPTTVALADPQAGSPVASRTATPQQPRVSPSFDCSRARLKTDRLICSDAELSQLDHDLGQLYAQAKAAAPDPAAFKRQSDREWSRREAECSDKNCLRRWYAERRAQLQASLEGRRQATGRATR